MNMLINSCRRSVALLSALGALALVGCSGAQERQETRSDGDWQIVGDTPDPVGNVAKATWAVRDEPASIDINRFGGTGEATIVANICDRLLRQNPDLELTPSLAEKASNPNPTTWVFSLRDATFHNGEPVTPEDVLWSLDRNAQPDMEDAEVFANVKSVRKTGPREVTVRLKGPDAGFERGMADDAGIIMDRELVQELGEDYGTAGNPDACAGPYRLDEWKAGKSLTITRDDDHWDTDSRPRTKTVEFVFAEGNALANGLKTGAIDGAYLDEPDLASAMEKRKDVDVHFGSSTAVTSLIPTDNGPMTDPNLRRAVSLAMDRSAIADAAFFGYAKPWKEPVGPGAWGYEEKTFEQTYDGLDGPPDRPSKADIAAAKKLVANADLPEEPIVVASRGDAAQSVLANAVQAAGQQIGLEVKVKTVTEEQYSAFFGAAKARAGIDLIAETWWISSPDPLGFYDNARSDEPNNWVGYSNDEYDELLDAAYGQVDNAERAKSVSRLAELFHDDSVWIPLTYVPNMLLMSSELTGPAPGAFFMFYPWATDLGAAK